MATNEILLFGGSATNILDQSTYDSSTGRTAGHVSGVASSQLENKVLKQVSLLAAGLAKFIADNQANNITDALTVQNIADYLDAAITAQVPAVANASTTVKGIVEIPTNAEAQAWSATGGTGAALAITPATMYAALQGANQSLVANGGFQIWPGGLVEKWGHVDITAEGAGTDNLVTVTFGTAFPNACFNVQLTHMQTSGAVSGSATPYLQSVSKTAFTAGIDTNAAENTYRVYWRAIGN